MPKPRKKSRTRPIPASCPCGTGQPYAECCRGLHDGTRTPTDPVEVMRARYTAFCLARGDYLWRSMHSQHEARSGDGSAFRAQVERSARANPYRRLQILDRRPADASGVAQVLFHAEAKVGKLDRSVVELSSFVEEEGEWRYIAGITRPASQLSHGVSDLSIDHWDCGHHH